MRDSSPQCALSQELLCAHFPQPLQCGLTPAFFALAQLEKIAPTIIASIATTSTVPIVMLMFLSVCAAVGRSIGGATYCGKITVT